MSYIYVTQNEIPYRLHLCKKDLKDTLLEICWTYNFFSCKKIAKKQKLCESYILICLNYKTTSNPIDIIKNIPCKKITIWKKLTGCVVIQQEIESNNDQINLDFLKVENNYKWIKTWTKQQKCLSCGRIYATNHNCDYTRSSFYYNQIAESKKYWESIHFQPIGENPNTKKIFLVYDIETYTLSSSDGTSLLPVVLCFSIFGDQDLLKIVKENIEKDISIVTNKKGYFWCDPKPNVISHKFKSLRQNILKSLVNYFLDHILNKENKEILDDFTKQKNYNSFLDINITEEKHLLQCLKVKPLFIEFYIIGHNIQAFDEVLLATQVLQEENFDFEPFLTINRNFMPRQGKILFNDITISFPFPDFAVNQEEKVNHTEEILFDLKEGNPSIFDLKQLYVKSMVRDTFQITHCSLKNAASAYNLPSHKGSCPFKAVNDLYSLGKYKSDKSGFPDLVYWSNPEEYEEQKNLWLQKNQSHYNLQNELIAYCQNDVLVTEQLCKTLIETFANFIKEEFNLKCTFNIFKRPTISSNSHAIFRQIHFSTEGTKPHTLPDIVAPSNEMYSFVRKSVRGGRCYPSVLGKFSEKLFVYDVCGMYASALTHPLPYGFPVGHAEKITEIKMFNKLLEQKEKISYFDHRVKPMIVTVDAFPPPPERLDSLPPLCSRKSGKLCWTNEALHDEIVTSIDILTLHNRGWKVKILPHKLNTVFPMWKTCCKQYVKANILAKEKATKENNPVKRSISKLLSNSLYGSFATKEDNDMIVFEHSLNKKIKAKLEKNELKIDSIHTIPTNNLPHETFADLTYYLKQREKPSERNYQIDDELNSPFTAEPDEESSYSPVRQEAKPSKYKPFQIVDVTSDSLTIYMLKSTTTHPTNKRYPTQLASFVLAWTRAFISQWAEVLFEDEYHIPIERKTLKTVYGDTDSMFLTQKGHNLMLTKGKNLLKTKQSELIFNEQNPQLTWAVECETTCDNCNSPAFCPESIFLAPKLYALKQITCPECKSEKSGKLRAKGHETTKITFELLCECFNYHKSCSKENRKYTTERSALKKTLCKSYGKYAPFTIHEINLIRELRPWHEPTLHFLTENLLIPFDMQHLNPNFQTFLVEEFENE
nr:DNA polymerase [Siadenovirus sp.]